MTMILRGGRILDAETRDAPYRDLFVSDGTILDVMPPGAAGPDGVPVRDVSGHLVIPGLVNGHTHGHGSLGKGRGDRWSLELLLNAGVWISGQRTAEDMYLATLLNAAEMIRRGCTATYDLTLELPHPSVAGIRQVARAYEDAGMRAVVAPMVADVGYHDLVPELGEALEPGLRDTVKAWTPEPWQVSIDACRDIVREWSPARDMVRPGLAPTIPMHCTDAFLEACRDLAREYSLPVHMHMAESKFQAILGHETYGMSLTRHVDRIGLVDEHFTAAHGVWLDDDEMRLLADRGASVVHNPGSNLRLGSGLAAVRRMLQAGLNVAVGSDGSNSSDNQNMFEAMRLATFVSRVMTHDLSRWVSADEAFRMTTLGGARAMGLDGRIGRIAPGYLADLVFIDLGDLAWLPLNDPLNQLVYADDGGSVDHVMINGRMVYEGRRFTTIDIDDLAARINRAMERLNTATDERRKAVKALEPVVADLCVCFMSRPWHVHRMCDEAAASADR
ncbi:MAG: amidohydrolase [bacterium]|nr:amidohydrolase [bacterium]